MKDIEPFRKILQFRAYGEIGTQIERGAVGWSSICNSVDQCMQEMLVVDIVEFREVSPWIELDRKDF